MCSSPSGQGSMEKEWHMLILRTTILSRLERPRTTSRRDSSSIQWPVSSTVQKIQLSPWMQISKEVPTNLLWNHSKGRMWTKTEPYSQLWATTLDGQRTKTSCWTSKEAKTKTARRCSSTTTKTPRETEATKISTSSTLQAKCLLQKTLENSD